MEILNLTIPKGTNVSDFFSQEEMQRKKDQSWFFLHDTVIDKLYEDGFKRRIGMHSITILSNSKAEMEIFVDEFAFPVRDWSVIIALRNNKNGNFNCLYEGDKISEPNYLIFLKIKE